MRERIGDREVDLSLLYPDLQRLVPLIRKRVTGNEEEEQARIRRASVSELEELSASWSLGPQALSDAYNEFMDEFNDGPRPHEAAVLGRYAELGFEASAEPDRRAGA